MAGIKKSAQAAALEATGLAGKIDELRGEFNARIDRCEDSLREEIGGVRNEIGGVRNEIGGIRDEIGGLREDIHGKSDDIRGLRKEIRDEIGGLREDIRGKSDEIVGIRDDIRAKGDDIRGIRDEITALRQETANDRRQMLQMLSRFMSHEPPLEVRDRGRSVDP